MQLQTLEDVFAEQIADLYDAERQLVQALPKVAAAASNEKLREAINTHLEGTRGHVTRLEEIFQVTDVQVPQEHCKGMEGLLKEGQDIISSQGDPDAIDAALIGAAQRVEHYEIAGYGTARTLADRLRPRRGAARRDTRRGGRGGQAADEDRHRRALPKRSQPAGVELRRLPAGAAPGGRPRPVAR